MGIYLVGYRGERGEGRKREREREREIREGKKRGAMAAATRLEAEGSLLASAVWGRSGRGLSLKGTGPTITSGICTWHYSFGSFIQFVLRHGNPLGKV